MSDISRKLGEHYGRAFAAFGATPKGVDWGESEDDHQLRLTRMLAVMDTGTSARDTPTMLDVGCGYGSLLSLVQERSVSLDYHGVDICEAMVQTAAARFPSQRWTAGDFLELEFDTRYDYVVCNGILTQKLDTSIKDMNIFARTLIGKMFATCNVGIAFNIMTTHVNFMADNLYYRNPVELLGWCISELTSRVRLDHAYPLFEYTVYLYREDAPGLAYASHRRSGG